MKTQVEIVKGQIDELVSFLETLPKQDKVSKKKVVQQWSYNKRCSDKNFIYLATLNSGKAGETLAGNPISSQKELYKFFRSFIICGYYVDFTDCGVEINFYSKEVKKERKVYYKIFIRS